jgi:SOS-response transcriptional repressor LexA
LADFFDVSLDQLVGKQPLTVSFANKNTLIPILPWDKAPKAKEFINDMQMESWQNWTTALKTDLNQHWYGLKMMQRTFKGAFAEKTILIVDADLEPSDGDYVIVYNKENHSVTLRQMVDNGVNVKLKSPNDDNECILIKKTETICGVVIQANVPISR